MSRQDTASAIGITTRAFVAYDVGVDVPPVIPQSARVLDPSRSAEADMGRERWVRAVYHLARYGRGDLDIRHLGPDEMADMLVRILQKFRDRS